MSSPRKKTTTVATTPPAHRTRRLAMQQSWSAPSCRFAAYRLPALLKAALLKAAEWVTSTTIKGTPVSGAGNFVKQTSPAIITPSIASIKDGSAFILTAIASAQTTPVQVAAKLIDGTGNVSREAFLHFELGNCGPNYPLTPGIATVAKTSFDLKPNQTNGSILGQVIGYDQILCGNVASTQYTVTPMKDAVTPQPLKLHYPIPACGAHGRLLRVCEVNYEVSI